MARSFRPLAKISVKISFKSHNRPKKTVWNRGFIRIVDNGEWVELSNFCKDHVNLPIERLYKNKLRGSEVQPYIFSIRLDANHPENEGKKLIRLNFNGNREGYEHALNSINNAFETFSERFKKQAKKLPGPQNKEKIVQKKVEKAAKVTESVPGLPKTRSAVALQLLQPSQPKPHRWVSEFDRLLGGPEKVSTPKVNDPQEEKRLAEIRRKNDLKLEQRKKEKAEKLRRAIQEGLGLKKKETVVEREVQAKQQKNKPIGAEIDSGLKLVDSEKARQPLRTVFYDSSNQKDPHNICTQLLVSLSPDAKPTFKHPVGVRKRLALRQGSVVKKGVKKPRKEPEQKTSSSRKCSNRAERSEGSSSTSSSKASSSKPAKKVNRESSTASPSQRSEGSSSTSSKASSSKSAKLEKSPSKPTKSVKASAQPPVQPVIDMWPSRIRGFSPCVSPDVSPSPSPKKAPKAPRKPSAKPPKLEISPSPSPKKPNSSSKPSSSKLQKLQKPQKPAKKAPSRKPSAKPYKPVKAEKSRKKLTISSGLEFHRTLSDEERTRQSKFWGSPARTYEMDLDFYEAPMDPPSGETSGYSSWNHSNSGFEDFQDSLEDVKLEPLESLEPFIDEGESEPAVSSIYMSAETGKLERKSSEKKIENFQRGQLERRSTEMNIENVHRGQHYIGKTFNDATFIDSRLTDCDIRNSTIINCIIENSSITNSRITT